MLTRKQMKKRAKQVVRKHYGILLAACLIGAFIGSEFVDSLQFTSQQDPEATEQELTSIETLPASQGAGMQKPSLMNVVIEALSGNTEGASATSKEMMDEAANSSGDGKGNAALGRSRGVFAMLINRVSSGALIVSMVSGVRSLGASTDVVLIIFILLVMLIFCTIWFFLINTYRAVMRRIFLESRTYEKVPIRRFLLFARVKRWKKVSVTMFMTTLLYFLWSLTIVGAFVKAYSYFMVPYIVAENPDIKWRDAISLSRRMMNGHKWECFVFELSFILWDMLGGITLGIISLLFVNQYKMASFAEYYAQLRQIAKESRMEGSQLMNDCYLFEKADDGTILAAYLDIMEMKEMQEKEIPLTGFRGFLANVFGVTLFRQKDEEKYEANEERRLKIESMKEIVDGQAYPGRLFPIPEEEKNSRVEQLHYLRHYSIPSLIMLFFIFSFIGWTWEVSLHLISDGRFVNRGVLHGPWLPIYGSGGIMILVLLNKLRKTPVLEFFATVVVCGCVEYFTAYYLEIAHNGQKWWDYSGYFLNLDGRICAEGLLVFGVGGLAIVYFAAPLLDNHLRRIRYRYIVPVCAALVVLFAADQVYSSKHPNTGAGITDYTSSIAPSDNFLARN